MKIYCMCTMKQRLRWCWRGEEDKAVGRVVIGGRGDMGVDPNFKYNDMYQLPLPLILQKLP